jgi:hypothetical protein
MRPRDDVYSLALDPSAWTHGRIGSLFVRVDADAEGGMEEISVPTHGLRFREDSRCEWQDEDVDAARPVLLEFEPTDDTGVDAVTLAGDDGLDAVTCWRTGRPGSGWLEAGDRILFAFDAAGGFDAPQRLYAHEFLETIFGALPPGCVTSVIANDGTLRLEPTGMDRHVADRAESMLIGLWKLEPEGEGDSERFLEVACSLAARAEGRCLLVFVAGPHAVPDLAGVEQLVTTDNVRVSVIRIGTAGPGLWRARCEGDPRVMLMDVPRRLAPWAAALDVVGALHWTTLNRVAVDVESSARAEVIPGACSLLGEPVLALISVGSGDPTVSGRFRAVTREGELTRPFELSAREGADADGPFARALLSDLKARGL